MQDQYLARFSKTNILFTVFRDASLRSFSEIVKYFYIRLAIKTRSVHQNAWNDASR